MNQDTNLEHIEAVSFIALFPGLRHIIGLLGLIGLVLAAMIAVVSSVHDQPVAINQNPTCNRELYLADSQLFGTAWGPSTGIVSIVNGQAQRLHYVKEANGTGYCVLQQESTHRLFGTELKRRYYEAAPTTELPPELNIVAKEQSNNNIGPQLAFWLTIISGVLLVGLWLPATLLAMAGRRLMHNVKETLQEE